jgi:hypothetical protein
VSKINTYFFKFPNYCEEYFERLKDKSLINILYRNHLFFMNDIFEPNSKFIDLYLQLNLSNIAANSSRFLVLLIFRLDYPLSWSLDYLRWILQTYTRPKKIAVSYIPIKNLWFPILTNDLKIKVSNTPIHNLYLVE